MARTTRFAPLMLLLGAAVAASGCGGSQEKRDAAREHRLVAQEVALCTSLHDGHGDSPSEAARRRAAARRIGPLYIEIRKAAHYLAAGRDLEAAYADRHALEQEILTSQRVNLEHGVRHTRTSRDGRGVRPERWADWYRIEMRIHHDQSALGLAPCIGPTPRPPIEG